MTIATLPPPREGISAELSRATGVAATDELRARLIGPDGTTIPLPAEVYIALCDVIRAMSRGNAVTIGVVESSITTQKAADLLCVSRPTLIKLLDAGEIPFTRPGRHRRIDFMTCWPTAIVAVRADSKGWRPSWRSARRWVFTTRNPR